MTEALGSVRREMVNVSETVLVEESVDELHIGDAPFDKLDARIVRQVAQATARQIIQHDDATNVEISLLQNGVDDVGAHESCAARH